MTEINGSCLCGSLTYHADSDALFAGVCHCKACQKSTGSAFSVVIGVKKTDFTITADSAQIGHPFRDKSATLSERSDAVFL